MTLLVTTLYNQHGKAKAKAAEVAESLTKVVGHTVAIEYDWKFVDQVAFKSMSTDIQKSILVNTLSGNLVQCLTGPQDSLAIALATSAPLRDLIKNIVKIVFSYDYANAISSAVGAGHLNIFVEGNSLHFKSNLNALHLQNNGDWGISLKLFGLVSSQPVTLVGESGSVPQVSVAADQVVISPPIVSVPLTLPSAAPVSIPKYKRVGGNPGGNGTTTFLYLSLEKVKKRIVELGTTLSSRVGSTFAFEVDLLTLVKDSVFMKESEADQKAFLMAAPDSWAGALYASTNGVSTVESALKIQVGVNKVKWIYTSSNKPTLGWSFLEISSSGSELLIKCSIADIDQKYGVGVEYPVAAASASTVIPAQQNCSPVPSVIPAVITLPPVSVQPVCDPVAHRSETTSTPSASNSSATSNCPVPGSRLATVGGKPGGNGTVSFLYASLERLKKMVNDTFPKEFSNVLGSARISFSLDVSFAKNPAFTNYSEADQRAFVSGPITHQISSIACQMVSGDHLLALFQNPEHSEYCSKITKITFSYSADVASDESWSFELSGNGTEIKIQIAIGSVDVFPDANTWGVEKKASACLALLRQIKAEEARVVAECEAKIALEKKMAEEDRLRLLKEEADRKHAAEEAAREKKEADLAKSIALLETSGVYQGLKANRGRLLNALHEASISGDIEFCVDSRFSYLEQLNWNKVGDQGATLLAIATSPKSLFTVLTDAAISIIESGTVGAKRLMETYKSFDLKFVRDSSYSIPPIVQRDATSGTLNIEASFSTLLEPTEWIKYWTQGVSSKDLYQGTNEVEIYKALIATEGGWFEEMAQDEATTKIDKILAPYIKDEFEGRLVAVEVDWNSLEQKNTNVNRILRYKKYLQFPSCVLEPLFQSFKIANLAVFRMLRAKLQKIRVVAKGVNSIVLENGGDLMIVSYDWSAQNFTDKQWKEVIEEEVHLKCQGTSVASISAEIALQTALGYHKLMNQELCNKAGMVAKDGGGEVLVLDFFSFADAPEFVEKYGPLRFKPLYTTCISALNSLVAGFVAISNTEVGAPIVKSIQRILIKLDVKSVDSTHDAVLHWDSETKTFTVTHSLQSFEHPRAYRYIPRLEHVLGILAESCRYATKAAVELFCSALRQDFGLSSLPIIFDESYLATQKFNMIHPREQKEIIVNFFTTIPPSIFLGPMGLLHCSEFPKSRQILHDKVKKIRIMPDDQLAAKTSKVELTNEELLVRLALDSTEWTAPIGYQLSQIIGSRPMIESEVIAEIDLELASYTQKLRSVSKNPKITAKFNWTALLKDQLFQASEKYVSDVRSLFSQVKMAFEGSGAETAIYDGGLFHFLEFEDLAAHMGNLETLEFHTSTKNSIISVGEFGLFTPYYYRVIREGNALHIYFNLSPYPVGVGSMVEWVLNPDQAKKREAAWVISLSERNFQEEMARRDAQVKNTIAANEAAVKKYELGVAEFNRQNAINANSPNTERCDTCWGKGGWHCGSSYTTCYSCDSRGWVDAHKITPVLPAVPQPRPIPTFPTVTVADFTRGLNRRELRQHHFIEAKLD